jgi:MEDS: MEthanogen/methylotroph, DcmR Sensory domain/Histidine kinase-like ATPase domain
LQYPVAATRPVLFEIVARYDCARASPLGDGPELRMTIDERAIALGADDHAVQFYDHDCTLTATVGDFLARALASDGVALMVTTGPHRRACEAELEKIGIDLPAAIADGTLVSLDATDTLSQFFVDGRIDRSAFQRLVAPAVHDAVRTGRPVHAYGDMVATLWEADEVLAAIELEEMWDDLRTENQFSLLCGYHTASVSDPAHADALERICELHTVVMRGRGNEREPAGSRVVEFSRWFSAEPDAPRAARRFVANALQRSGHADTVLEDAQLVISELATNAVVHARSPFSVYARSDDSLVHLAVRDESPLAPVVRSVSDSATSGRGLHVVAALTRDWGFDATTAGKAVWAELDGR